MGNIEDSKRKYNDLFDLAAKAEAFDKLAELYYCCNFATTPKAEVDLLMFSLYLDEILKKSGNNSKEYSDYILSKSLGITQSRISSLKEKKQLKYPNEDIEWKELFLNVSKNARYENGKIKVQIPDKILYHEIKNAIEEAGGYVDIQLNYTLLQTPPEYFIDLLMLIKGEDDRSKFKSKLRKEIKSKDKDVEYFDDESIPKIIKKQFSVNGIAKTLNMVIGCVASNFGDIKEIIEHIITTI